MTNRIWFVDEHHRQRIGMYLLLQIPLADCAQLTAAALTKTSPIAQEIHEKGFFFILDTLDLKAISFKHLIRTSVDTNIINSA